MTTIAVLLIGVGVILIASSLDNTPIVTTFQKLINGNAIDWSGVGAQGQPTGQANTGGSPYSTPQIQQNTNPSQGVA